MSEPEKKLTAIAAFMQALTPRGVALFIVLFGAAAIGYAIWEQRASLLPAYLSSTTALVETGVAITLILVGLVLTDLYGRLEDRAERAMRVHTEALQAQITLQTATIADQSARIAALVSDHAACQKHVAELAIVIARIQHQTG